MAPDLITKVSSASSFGVHNSRKSVGKGKCGDGRFAVWAGFVVLLSIGCLVSMIVITVAANTQKPRKTTKIKRFIEFDDSITKAEEQSEMTNDVRLVPENEPRGNRRMGKHPNHRYAEMESEDKIYKKMMKDLYAESGWSPKPLGGEIEKPRNNIRGIISEGRTGGGKLKALGSPMRLKGFYIEPHSDGNPAEDQDNEFSDNYYYLREINGLMRNDSRERENEEKWLMEKDFKSHGLPFRLPAKEFEPMKRYETGHSRKKNYWTKGKSKKNKSKPVTILLEIYPMTDTKHPNTMNDRKSFPRQPHFPKRPGYEPVTSSSSTNLRIVGSNRKKNKMLMKLTLYPKKKEEEEEDIKEFYPPDDNKRAERRTFSFFFKKKKKKHEAKECLVIGLHPYGKPITAKWKDDNGEWLYAKHVTLKHFDDEDEDDEHWH